MNLVTYHITSQSEEEMMDKEQSVLIKLRIFKRKHPNFSFKLEKDEVTNTLIVKQLSMYESVN